MRHEEEEGSGEFDKVVHNDLPLVEPHGRLVHVVGKGVRNGLRLGAETDMGNNYIGTD